MGALVVQAPTHPDRPLPSKEVVRVGQQRALVQEGIRKLNTYSFRSPPGTAVLDSERLFRITFGGSQVL